MTEKEFDIIILGAGAGGLMAAIAAGEKGKSILLIDRAESPGRKLLASGGGKCNFTNRNISENDYFGENPEFCKYALRAFTSQHAQRWAAEAGIATEEREHGRIFCQHSASVLLSVMRQQVAQSRAHLLLETAIESVEKQGNLFFVHTTNGVWYAKKVIVATGGLAWPQLGASDIGMRIAKHFGHKVIPTRPALAGVILPTDSPLVGLQGISLPVRVSLADKSVDVVDHLLFTHRGISGPAALQLSCNWTPSLEIIINFLPEKDALQIMHEPDNGKLLVKTAFTRFLPDRLVQRLIPSDLLNKKIAVLGKAVRKQIFQQIHNYTCVPVGTESFLKAETTRGGVDTSQVNPKTMESRLVEGLYFCGEVLDVAGKLGGYNIHWAFASGIVAAQA